MDVMGAGAYVAGDDELRVLDEALAEVERGDLATDEEVEAAFRSFRG